MKRKTYNYNEHLKYLEHEDDRKKHLKEVAQLQQQNESIEKQNSSTKQKQ